MALRLILVGQEDVLSAALFRFKAGGHPRIVIRHASQLVSMGESPAQALRVKKDSSMRWRSTWSSRAKPTPASAPATPAR